MLIFTVFAVLLLIVIDAVHSGQLYGIGGEVSGLNFDGSSEYAAHYDDYKPRDYHFSYGVSDPHTGDHKSQWETKENGVVRGGYSLLEPDGTTRIVEYVADHEGFRAVVKKIGHSIHPQVEVHGQVDPVPSVPVVVPSLHPALPETVPPTLPVVPTTIHSVPPSLPVVPTYSSYDGHAENYIPKVPFSQIVPLLGSTLVDQAYHHLLDSGYKPVESGHESHHVVPQYGSGLIPNGYQVVPNKGEPQLVPSYGTGSFEHGYQVVPHVSYQVPQYQTEAVPKYEVPVPKYEVPGPKYEVPVPKYEVPVFKYQVPNDVKVEYHGLTGNPDDDSEYTKDYTYESDSSPTNQHFTISFPDFVKRSSWRR